MAGKKDKPLVTQEEIDAHDRKADAERKEKARKGEKDYFGDDFKYTDEGNKGK